MSSLLAKIGVSILSLSLLLGSALAAELPALAQLKLRAEAGDPVAQYDYAQRITSTNPGERNEWIRKSAEQGYATAQDALAGSLRSKGTNAAERQTNRREAAHWASRAAHQGFTAAQLKLGQFYDGGVGVTKDSIKAYMWAKIATQNSIAGTVTGTGARSLLNGLIANMSSADIAEGHRLASAFKLPIAPGLNPIEADLVFSQLVLSAVYQAGGPAIGVINGIRFSGGDTKSVKIDDQNIPLQCVAVDARSAQVAIPGTSYRATIALSTGTKAR